jgi:hypothetical protein
MDEDAIKDVIYRSVDKGLVVSYFSGGLGCFAIYQILNGGSWWAIIPCGILSLMGFFVGRYMSLKFLFDNDIECRIEDVGPTEEEEG